MSNESEFETYLSGNSTLSQIYRGGPEERPAAGLSASILLAARHSVEAPRHRRSLAWTLPVSLAAALALGVSVVALMYTSKNFGTHTISISRVAIPPASPSAIDELTTSITTVPVESDFDKKDLAPSIDIKLSSLREHSSAEITNTDPQSVDQDLALSARLATREPEWMPNLMDNPSAWRDYIELLQLHDRVDEVSTHARAFRARYPDVALPDIVLASMRPDPTGN